MLKRTFKKWLRLLNNRLRSDEAKTRRDAERLARTVLHEYKRLGFSRTQVKRKGKKINQHVRFEEPLLLTQDALWMPIDLQKLPTGVKTSDIEHEDVIKSMRDRLHKSFRYDRLGNGKVCAVVSLKTRRFPIELGINAMNIPDELPSTAFPIGNDSEGITVFCDIGKVYHLLIGGATGKGKTRFLHNIMYWLITRNDETRMNFWLIDLKNGNEFGIYERIASVKECAWEPLAALSLLEKAFQEIERRNKLLRRYEVNNIEELAERGVVIPRIVLVVDELSNLMLDKTKVERYTLGSLAENALTKIAAMGRSVGLNTIIATQAIQSDVISGLILANYETRIAFSTADWRKSQMIIESSMADGLPKGRCIYRFESELVEVQSPLITSRELNVVLGRIRRNGVFGGLGEDQERQRFLKDVLVLFELACKNYNGSFSRNKLLSHEDVNITQNRFNEIAARLEMDGVLIKYKTGRVIAAGFVNRPHLLEALYSNKGPNSPQTGQKPIAGLLTDNSALERIQTDQTTLVKDSEKTVDMAVLGEVIPSAFLRAFSEEIEGENNENEQE